MQYRPNGLGWCKQGKQALNKLAMLVTENLQWQQGCCMLGSTGDDEVVVTRMVAEEAQQPVGQKMAKSEENVSRNGFGGGDHGHDDGLGGSQMEDFGERNRSRWLASQEVAR